MATSHTAKPQFVKASMAELHALRYFFLTLDTELDEVIEREELKVRASDPTVPSHEAVLASPPPELFPETEGLDALYDEQYWEEIGAKFRPHFYASVTLLTVAVLEAGFTRLCRFLRLKNELPISPGQVKGSTLEQLRIFAKLSNWPLPSDDLWSWATDLYEVRNALVHEGGNVYGLAEPELAKRRKQLRSLAQRRAGIAIQDVYEMPSVLEQLGLIPPGAKRRRVALEGLTVVVHRDYCAAAIEQSRRFLQDVFLPFEGHSSRRHGAKRKRGK